jgi:hypothetical protein
MQPFQAPQIMKPEKRIDAELTEACARRTKDVAQELQAKATVIQNAKPRSWHVICQTNYLLKLDMIVKPYLSVQPLLPYEQQKWDYLMWPEQYKPANLHRGRMFDVPIIEGSCKCNGCGITGGCRNAG